MKAKVMKGTDAVSEAVRLCGPKVVPAYPITPSTGIVEKLSKFVADGTLDAEFITVESEHSAISAAIGASAAGVRTFTATASQGLALMHEILFIASGMRLPIVMAVGNRSLSAPLSIWCDWSDSMAQRDAGWIQFYCENLQEAFDTTIMAFKISEKCFLPSMVCMDGFILTHCFEPVVAESASKVREFLPDFRPFASLSKDNVSMGCYATPEHYQGFKLEQQKAMFGSNKVIKETNKEFEKMFGRSYGDGMLETYGKGDFGIITMGSVSGTIKDVIDEIGGKLIRIKTFRPFPSAELRRACRNLSSVGVFEKATSLGSGGPLYTEVKAELQGTGIPVSGFVGGLGGKDVTKPMIKEIFRMIKEKKGTVAWI